MDYDQLKASANQNAAQYLRKLRTMRDLLPITTDEATIITRTIVQAAIIVAELIIQQAEDA